MTIPGTDSPALRHPEASANEGSLPPPPPPPRHPERSEGSRRFARLHQWTAIFAAYFSAQGATQAAGLLAGLLLVNFLPVEEFALYALAASVLSFFTFATDLGSTSSLLYFSHRAAKEGEAFEPYVAAVISLRRLAFLLGAFAVVAAFPVVAIRKGFGGWEVGLATAAVLAAVWFQIDGGIRVLVLRLANRYGPSYRADLAGGLARLVLAAAMVASGLLFGWLAMATTAAGVALMALVARCAAQLPSPPPGGVARERRAVLRYLLPTLPGAAYYSIQGPLGIWLATTFGSTRTMAETGALGRLGLVLSLFSGLTGIVFLPRLARITDERLYLRRYLQFGGFLLLVGLGLFAVAWAFPDLLLLLIGDQYAGLHRELLLVAAGAGVGLLGGYSVGVNNSRSWTKLTGAAVVALVVVQAVLVAILPLGTTAGVLAFGLLSGLFGTLGQFLITGFGFWRPTWVQWRT
ncbi:MAG: hypothetical protein M5U13_10675 [Thermoanaerobaculia bacterium]|nr:hypothetical protein [Thermoanaerobaculia bacterium]